MKVRFKILLGFVIIAVMIILSFVVFLQIKDRRDSLLIRSYHQEHELSVTTAMRTSEEQLKTLVRDYALWDEMVKYVLRPDTSWSRANLSTLILTHTLSGVWIFGDDKSLIFFDPEKTGILNPMEIFPDSLFRYLSVSKTAFFFLKRASTVYEFAAGTIRPTHDTLMREKSSGFFIVARALDERTLRQMEEVSGSSIIFQSALGKDEPPSNASELITTITLNTWNGRPAGYLEFKRIQPLLRSYIDITLTTSVFYFIFALSLLFLTSLVLFLWVYLPLKQITESLALENTSLITPLAKKKNEFGQIAFLIERFFLQKKELALIIHEKNEALASFADAESKNTAILSAIPDHLFRLNLFGIISDYHINKTDDFLFDETGLIGKNIDEVFPGSLTPMIRESINEINNTKTPQSFDFSIPYPNGLRKYYDVTLTVTSMGDYLAIIRNITTRKEAEIALQRLLQKEGELSRLKTQFISTVSHEFRTPLSAISSNIELLEMYDTKWPVEKKSTAFARIQEAVTQLTSLLKNLSLVAKDQSGKVNLNPVEFDLEALCEGIINDNLMEFNQSVDVDFKFSLPQNAVQMDRDLVRYIVTNLVSNAIKFSPRGSVVKFTITRAPDAQVEFSIEDKGIGIPEKDLDPIFEPFHRGKNALEFPGTGLGLSIVKRCVETHKGSIHFDSAAGKGTKVVVRLPEIVSKSEEP